MSPKVIRILPNLYRDAKIQIKLFNKLSENIAIIQGILQGKSFLHLFSLPINDNYTYLHEAGARGLNIDGIN